MNRAGLYRLVGSMLLIQVGMTMTYVALPLLLAQRYGLGVETGLVLALQVAAPVLLAGPVGVAIEHFDARRMAVLAAVTGGALVALFPLSSGIGEVALLAFLTGACFAFGVPARMALRPQVIEVGEEARGNSLLVASERLATVLGPAFAGVLFAIGGVDVLFYVEAVAAVAAGALLLGLEGPSRQAADTAVPWRAVGVQGWWQTLYVEPARGFHRMLRSQPTVRALSLTALGYVTAVGASRLLLTDQGPRLFGGEGAALGYLMAAMALGGVIGAMVGGRFGHQHQGRVYIIGNLCEAPCWPLLLLAQHEIPALLIMVLAGIFESAPTVAYYAEVQTRLSPSEVSAYYASLMPLTQISSALGALGGGLLLAAGGAWALSIAMACLIAGPIIALSGSLAKISPGGLKPADLVEERA